MKQPQKTLHKLNQKTKMSTMKSDKHLISMNEKKNYPKDF